MVWKARKSLGTTLFFLVSAEALKLYRKPKDNLAQRIQNRYLPPLVFILDIYCKNMFPTSGTIS